MPRSLPPLNAVRAFDSAARHLNLSRAAEELGVTQGAISKQVIALEDYIGAKLFERLPGGLSLTSEGREIKRCVQPAFDQLYSAFQLHSRRGPRSNVVRVTTLTSLATQFIAPRLMALKETVPDVELELVASDRLVDFGREEVDFGIRYGRGDWDGLTATPLVPPFLVPVCAPCAFERAGGTVEGVVTSLQRMQIFAADEWRAWSAQSGIAIPKKPAAFYIEDFLVVLKVALEGQGIALLPHVLVADQLADGRLLRLSEKPVQWTQTYHLTHAPGTERRPFPASVMKFFRDEAAKLNASQTG